MFVKLSRRQTSQRLRKPPEKLIFSPFNTNMLSTYSSECAYTFSNPTATEFILDGAIKWNLQG